jgi:hypothetical protein
MFAKPLHWNVFVSDPSDLKTPVWNGISEAYRELLVSHESIRAHVEYVRHDYSSLMFVWATCRVVD